MVMSTKVVAQSQQQLFQQNLNKVHPVPTDPPAGLSQTDLAWYAWRLFSACNQGTAATVSDGSKREAPASTFISTGVKPGPFPNPLLFEAFYHRTEAYPYFTGATAPSPLKKAPYYRFAPIEGEEFSVSGKKANYVNLDETNQIGQNFIFYRKSKKPMFPILYMAKVNSLEVTYAQAQANKKNNPNPNNSWLFPPNTLEVKSAWRPVEYIKNSDPNTYHQATATWYEGLEGEKPTVKTGTFALIALHIIQKSDNYKSFIYTTFEHVDAVTREKGEITDPAYQLTYRLLKYNGESGIAPQATVLGAYSVNDPNQGGQTNAKTTYMLPPGNPANGSPAPNLTRPPGAITQGGYVDPEGEKEKGKYKTAFQPKTITKEVNDVNNSAYKLLKGSIWQNYRLKGVQATPTSDETTADFFLANIVVETSQPGVQLMRGGVGNVLGLKTFTNDRSDKNLSIGLMEGKPVPTPTINMGGCMGCHGVAQTTLGTDFSFLPPGAGFKPDTEIQRGALSDGLKVDSVPGADATIEELKAHKDAIYRRKASVHY